MRGRNLETLVREKYEQLNENETDIWNYIVTHKEQCKEISIQQLAVFCHVSRTTILRFAKKLGFSGYSEMRTFLKWESKAEFLFKESDIDKCCNSYVQTIEDLKYMDMTHICEMIFQAEEIYVHGTGEVQRDVAKELKRRMFFQNIFINHMEGTEEVYSIIDMLRENDVFFLISLSGKNETQIEMARRIKEKGCKIVLIAMYSSGELYRLADETILFRPEEIQTVGYEYKHYSTLYFYIINSILALKYMEYGMKREKA